MTNIAFIDCFSQTPANNCVNDFILRTQILSTYHMVSQYGLKSLNEIPNPSAYIVLGSASHLSEQLAWHKDLALFIDKKLKENIPVLGICFTHQLMAQYYGSEIDYIDESQILLKESRRLTFSKKFLGYKELDQINLAYCHSQVIKKLSNNFDVLATSSKFDYEIIQHKQLPFFGLQAHPEASLNFLLNDAKITDEALVYKTKTDGDSFLAHFISSLK